MTPSSGSFPYLFQVKSRVSMDVFPAFETYSILTRLINVEDLIAFSHHESIKPYAVIYLS